MPRASKRQGRGGVSKKGGFFGSWGGLFWDLGDLDFFMKSKENFLYFKGKSMCGTRDLGSLGSKDRLCDLKGNHKGISLCDKGFLWMLMGSGIGDTWIGYLTKEGPFVSYKITRKILCEILVSEHRYLRIPDPGGPKIWGDPQKGGVPKSQGGSPKFPKFLQLRGQKMALFGMFWPKSAISVV